jgi:hypothetical protein
MEENWQGAQSNPRARPESEELSEIAAQVCINVHGYNAAINVGEKIGML